MGGGNKIDPWGLGWRGLGRQVACALGGSEALAVSEKLEGVGVRELEGGEAVVSWRTDGGARPWLGVDS